MSSSSPQSSAKTLTLAAIGVVYGDIGTSPLYTMKEVFSKEHGLELNPANLLGIVSLIFWGLTVIVSLKYVSLVLRANNRGEGGIMALTSLAMSAVKQNSHWQYLVMLLGLAGAALFFGDGVITPAISVLSAMEGLEVAAPALHAYILPSTVVVLVALYLFQKHGTAGIGRWFGPIMTTWFAVLAGMGFVNIMRNPGILAALNPLYAFQFLTTNRWLAFIALGAVVLA
ncbi:MAG: potassium transporter Kup, partial [Herminiimonas sp.]|nr:potassium transporter Kup [Herminiimonas sp.]